MRIELSPTRRDDALFVSKIGDVLTINGQAYNFTDLPNGASIPAGEIPCDWIVGPVERMGGDLRLKMILPIGPSPTHEQAFPSPIVNPADGTILNVPAHSVERED